MATIISAVLLAERAHRTQTRQSDGDPYLTHPLRVAGIVAECAHLVPEVDREHLIAAAVLHDVLEDSAVTREEMAQICGEEVTSLVEEVTNPTLPKVDKKRWQVSHAAELSPGACLIKTADKLDNLQDHLRQPIWGLQRTQGYLLHAREVVDQMPVQFPALRQRLDRLWDEGVIRAPDGTGPALSPTLTLEDWYQSLTRQ